MNILTILLVTVSYFFLFNFVTQAVKRIGENKGIRAYRIKYTSKTIHIALTAVFAIVIFLLLGIEYSQVSLFLSSVFAVTGVALFAQWSILSNITASLIIFFAFPYRVGDTVRIVDKDDDLSGVIEEISLFHVIIRRDEDMITYPNSLILQKAVIKVAGVIERPRPEEIEE